jgi:hypothetical protein
MNNAKVKQRKITECQSTYALQVFQQFVDGHLVEGQHLVRMFQDPSGNYFAIFCTVCDPEMGDVMEPPH